MKNKIAKILGVVLTVVTLASVFVVAAPATAAPASQAWSQYGIPSTSGMVLNTAITLGGPIAQASDSSALYAYVLDGATNRIIKSVNNGRTWTKPVVSGAPTAAVLEIVCSPVEANVVFYMTATTMFMSTDSGANFTAILSAPTGALLTSFDVAKWGTPSRYIAVVGTNEAGVGSEAGVYYWDQSLPFNNLTPVGTNTFSGWQSTAAGTVLSVKMAPTFTADRTVVAVGVDTVTNTTMVRMNVNGGQWGATVPDFAAALATTAPTAADIAFPADFNYATSPIYFVAVSDPTVGGIYRVIGNVPTSVDATRTVTNLSYNGSFASATATCLAGTSVGTVGRSTNSGNTFAWAGPGSATIRSNFAGGTAWVLLDKNYATTKLAWVLNVGGANGALNVTTDGSTFNQWSLINETIRAANGIVDLAVAANGDLYMITINTAGTDTSIWRQLNSASTP